jgi:hypothetical protein
MTIADTIRSLKPGDQVRVTFEDEVTHNHVKSGGVVHLSNMGALYGTDPTITSIEVIERPLAVGDFVVCGTMTPIGTITALDGTYALCHWPDRTPTATPLSDLRRAS